MSLQVFHIRFVRPTPGDPGTVIVLEDDVRAVLDGGDPAAFSYWMGRLLHGCADRHGLPREQAHVVVAETRAVDRDGHPTGPVARWVLAGPDED